jgi:hypothetical protein
MAQLMADLGALGQIPFPATQNPSADPHTLDDYEEGTFTPTFETTGTQPTGVTYSQQLGYYTKIGDLLFYAIRVVLTNAGSGGTGNVRIGGLPFVVASILAVHAGVLNIANTIIAAGYSAPYAGPNSGASNIAAALSGSGLAGGNVAWSDATNSSIFRLSGFYKVA